MASLHMASPLPVVPTGCHGYKPVWRLLGSEQPSSSDLKNESVLNRKSEGVSVSICCVTSQSSVQWLKTVNIFLTIPWVTWAILVWAS